MPGMKFSRIARDLVAPDAFDWFRHRIRVRWQKTEITKHAFVSCSVVFARYVWSFWVVFERFYSSDQSEHTSNFRKQRNPRDLASSTHFFNHGDVGYFFTELLDTHEFSSRHRKGIRQSRFCLDRSTTQYPRTSSDYSFSRQIQSFFEMLINFCIVWLIWG